MQKIDLKNKSINELRRLYFEISKEILIRREIWEKTEEPTTAAIALKKYKEQKKDRERGK